MSQHFYGNVAGVADPLRFSARLTATYVADAAGVHRLGLASAGSARLLLDGNLVAVHQLCGVGGQHAVRVGERRDRRRGRARRRSSGRGRRRVRPGHRHSARWHARRAHAARPGRSVRACRRGGGRGRVRRGRRRTRRHVGDRGQRPESFALPGRQDELVARSLARNPRTVVVVNAGSPVALPWADEVAAIVHAGYPGQQFGRALADVLFGDVSPSGKLATTWPARLEDCAAHGSYPGRDGRVALHRGSARRPSPLRSGRRCSRSSRSVTGSATRPSGTESR